MTDESEMRFSAAAVALHRPNAVLIVVDPRPGNFRSIGRPGWVTLQEATFGEIHRSRSVGIGHKNLRLTGVDGDIRQPCAIGRPRRLQQRLIAFEHLADDLSLQIHERQFKLFAHLSRHCQQRFIRQFRAASPFRNAGNRKQQHQVEKTKVVPMMHV